MAKEIKEVYCQYCGADITDLGGDVASNNKIYCHGGSPVRCIELSLMKDPTQGVLFGNYMNSKEVQKEIRKGKLIHFNALEKSVSKD